MPRKRMAEMAVKKEAVVAQPTAKSQNPYTSEYRIQRALKTLEAYKNLGSEGRPDFDWPTTSVEGRRIHDNSKLYRELSIEEAFAHAYGVRMSHETLMNLKDTMGQHECRTLKPGDIVELRILDINKKGVVFEQNAYKETIVSTINLYQYPTFKQFLPKDPVKCKVMSVDLNKIYVDPFQPLIEDFIQEVQGIIKTQANVKNPIVTKVTGLQHMRSGYIGRIRIPSISEMCGKDMYMQAFVPGSQITLNIEDDFEKWDGKDIDAFITNLSVRPGTTNVTVACSAKEYLRFKGNLNIIKMFKDYCEDNKAWKALQNQKFEGNITGVCNTRNKTGVFVEIPSIGVTGMVPCSVEALTSYHPGPTKVKITGFDELVKFNKEVGQMQHVEPWKIEDDILKRINVKCILEFVA